MPGRWTTPPLDSVLEHASTLFALLTPEGKLTWVNRAVLDAVGLPLEAVCGGFIWEGNWFRDLPEEAARVRDEVACAARGEVVRKIEVAYENAAGEKRYARRSLIPIRNAAGEVEAIFVECQDVTDRAVAERTLHEQEVELRTIVDFSFGFFCLVGVDGRVRRVNPASCIATGTTEAEVVGCEIWDVPWWRRIPEEVRTVRETFEAALEGRSTRREVPFHAADGSTRFADHSVTPVIDNDGRVYDVIFEGLDITERLLTEERLRRSEGRYRALVEQSQDGVILCSPEGVTLDLNPAAVEILGFGSRAEAVGLGLGLLFGNPPSVAGALEAVRRRGFARNVELRSRAADGSTRTLIATIGTVHDPDGASLLLVVVRDLSGWRTLEERLRQTQKLEALGRMAAGVAHEINNPLTWVLSNLEAVAFDLERLAPPLDGDVDPSELALRVREAHEGAVRVARIVRDLKSFTRPEHETADELDVNEVLAHALKLARNELRYRARIVVETGDVPAVRASEDRLLQVFLNLLLNAGQALEGGAADTNEIHVRTTRSNGEVRVEIADSGCGIPEENLEKLFDPFFTTKAPGVGSGLGLWICQGIVNAAGGRIEVTSDPGSGSRFTVCLPALEAVARRKGTRSEETSVEGPAGRILVVEDEPYIRAVTARMLGRRHAVVTTASAEEALDLLTRDGGFDLVLCDLMMDGLDGVGFQAALRQLNAGCARRVAFMTGGAYDDRTREFLDSPDCRWIEKPFDKRALLEFVDGLLRAQDHGPGSAESAFPPS